jgi:acyl-CoA synthetase (NDP forming)
MGFYNVTRDLCVGIFEKPRAITPGGISHIAQSGSVFTALCHNGCRLGFNLCVSAGNEMTVTLADYMDWSLAQSDTRVISLFIETLRDPGAFVTTLEKARAGDIPVVALKVGRSGISRDMALTHTGAIAGDYAAFSALCRRHGVIEVDDLDEMAATLAMLQTGREATSGGLAAIFESGGFRELFADLAEDNDVAFANISPRTRQEIARHLDPGLVAENPLDAWGTHHRFEERFLGCLRALLGDSGVAGGVFASNFRDGYFLSEGIFRAMETVSAETTKPLALVNMYSDLDNADLCRRGFEAGIPVLDGARPALRAFAHLFALNRYRCSTREPVALPVDDETTAKAKTLLATAGQDAIEEHPALEILSGFNIPAVARRIVEDVNELAAAVDAVGYPLVLKTAEPGILHKSEVGGVVVDIRDPDSLERHYHDLATRLGPRALVCAMAPAGVEIALGVVNDPQFGPLVLVAAGGILVETLDDRELALCPVSRQEAAAMLSRLRVGALLQGVRGRPAADREALVDAIVNLSRFAHALADQVAEVDINPVIATSDGVVAVDALILRKPVSRED